MDVEAVTGYLSYLKLQKRFSAHTSENYQRDLRQFYSFLQSESPVAGPGEISYQHIRHFLASLMEEGYSPVTVNRKLSCLRSYFRYLVKSGKVGSNPCQKVSGPRQPKRLPAFIDEESLGTAFSELEFTPDFEGARNKLIVEILYQTGMRRAEILQLQETDVDLYSQQLKVMGKRSKERIIPFGIGLRRIIEQYLTLKKELGLTCANLVVTKKNAPMTPAQLTKTVTAILGRITTAKKKSPHTLRHSFATHMLNSGADINAVKELLGHASLAATQVYTHNTIDKLKKTYNQAHPRSGN